VKRTNKAKKCDDWNIGLKLTTSTTNKITEALRRKQTHVQKAWAGTWKGEVYIRRERHCIQNERKTELI